LGTPYRSSYAASKHAVHGYFDCLRAEVHKFGIQTTIVTPGFVNTGITLRSYTGDGSRYGEIDSSLAKGLSPQDCARRIYDGVQKGKSEFFVGGIKERAALILKRILPSLLFRLVRTQRTF
jgi:dehydrogenase/reductase SDR family member 7B